MARSVNLIILLGNLGKDPEVRCTPSGAVVCTLTVATTDSWKDKNTGEKVEETEWHRVILWNRLAEIAGEYLRKGRQVHVMGKKKTRSYEQDGQTKYITEIVASDLQILGGKGHDTPQDAPVYHSQEGGPGYDMDAPL